MITKKDSIASGVVDYFRNALAAIGRHSRLGNEKYPPAGGCKDLRWSFDVSTEHADAIMSHLAQRGEIDPETGYSHTVALAWRSLALLESELVAAGAKPGRAVARAEPVQSKVEALRHPAEKLAIEAFKAEQCPCGDIECPYEPFPDRFDALKGGPDAG